LRIVLTKTLGALLLETLVFFVPDNADAFSLDNVATHVLAKIRRDSLTDPPRIAGPTNWLARVRRAQR
jgi:hypothetical protein